MKKDRLKVNATPEGLVRATNALKRSYGTKLNLAKNLTGSVGRNTVQNFFKGEAIQIDKFKEICKALNLESVWEEIAGLSNLPVLVALPDNEAPKKDVEEVDISVNIDALVQEVREKVKPYIQERCGTIRVLDMTHPIGLDDIYTDVNILEKITGHRGLNIAELLQN